MFISIVCIKKTARGNLDHSTLIRVYHILEIVVSGKHLFILLFISEDSDLAAVLFYRSQIFSIEEISFLLKCGKTKRSLS